MIEDFRDLLRELLDGDVQFLVVGAHALSVYGIPRATGDLDLWVRRDAINAQRVIAALVRFGARVGALGISADDFTRPDTVAQLGLPPYRIDLMTSLSGVEFEDAWAGRIHGLIEGVEVPVIGQATFIVNKRATGRRKDAAYLEALGEL